MQRIIATIGVPRSGKSTYAQSFDPNYWVNCTFDDFRQTLWPPHRRVYWQVREGPNSDKAKSLLHEVKYTSIKAALMSGFNVVVPDTHTREIEANDLKIVASRFLIDIEWKVLDVPWEVLKERNNKSDETRGHKVPDEILKSFYERVWAPDAWWRSEPGVEIIPYGG